MLEILSSVQFLATDVSNFCRDSQVIWKFVGNIVNIMQIAIPVIIILLGTLDLGKAVMAGEDKQIKAAQKMLIMRLIYGIAIFFVVLIIKVIFGLVGEAGESTNSWCFTCVSKPGECSDAGYKTYQASQKK